MASVLEIPTDGDLISFGPMAPKPFVVHRFRKETDDTFTLELDPEEGRSRFAFKPGQFNMVYVYGVGEVPISISGSPSSPRLVHTTRAVGTVTKMMAKLKKGDVVGIRGPYGTTWPVEQARSHDVVVVAGGIGLPPLRGALHEILDHRKDYGKVVLLYGVRTPSDILFKEELEQWRARFDMEVFITVDRAAPDWRGNVGVVTTLISKAGFDPQNTVAMVVGPEVMMRFTALEFVKRGVKGDSIYLSMERNMKCGIGLCGHCQFGPYFVCKDGPVFRYSQIKDLLVKWEI
jgi:NAD(P)H-flavin reductase